MFGHFRFIDEGGQKSTSIASGNKNPLFFVFADYHQSEQFQEDGLMLAVTNGSSAWTTMVNKAEFQALVKNSRVGTVFGSIEQFKIHTAKAFNQLNEGGSQVDGYIVEIDIHEDGCLELKWKFRHSGMAQTIGRARLSRGANVQDINCRILGSSLAHHTFCHLESQKQNRAIIKIERSMVCLNRLISDPPTLEDISQNILDRTVGILNSAKRRNRHHRESIAGVEPLDEAASFVDTYSDP